jgi:hypothetical protein
MLPIIGVIVLPVLGGAIYAWFNEPKKKPISMLLTLLTYVCTRHLYDMHAITFLEELPFLLGFAIAFFCGMVSAHFILAAIKK